LTVLLLNQTFYPDVVSTAQHLTDLALSLVERGHEVTVCGTDDLKEAEAEFDRQVRDLIVAKSALPQGGLRVE
jgi:hypothetical protein